MKPGACKTWMKGGALRAVLAVAALSVLGDVAQSADRATQASYASFKLITDRNIFSPSRTASRPMQYRTTEVRKPSAKGESFSLVGTMEFEKGRFAFFDGTVTDYHKSLKPGDSIAGYKLAEIGHNQVRLARDTNALELKLGMVMRRDENDEWFASESSDASVSKAGRSSSPGSSMGGKPPSGGGSPPGAGGRPSSTGGGPPPAPAGSDQPPVNVAEGEQPPPSPEVEPLTTAVETNSESASAGGAPENDVLRRLMQRREQEINR